MIFDGYWKKELRFYVKQIKRWQRLSTNKFLRKEYIEHQINKYILYSAIVIRKMIEEEKDAEKTYNKSSLKMPKPKFELLNYKIPVRRFPFSGDKDFILHHVISDYYKGQGEKDKLDAEYVGNSIIHSYIWNLGYAGKGNQMRVEGFLVSSDRFKDRYLYLIILGDWMKYVSYCAEKCVI